MSIDMNAIDELLSGNSAAFKFETIGDTCKGRIVSAKVQQQSDINTGQPKTFQNGDPMNQLVVTVEQEDGTEAAIYFKGGKFDVAEGKGDSSLEALKLALDGQQLTEGGTLAVQFSGLGKKKNAGFSAPKLYTCAYKAPVASVDVGTALI